MPGLIYGSESYKIIGVSMDVHNQLGPGFLEIVYKDALEYEFTQLGIPYTMIVIRALVACRASIKKSTRPNQTPHPTITFPAGVLQKSLKCHLT